MVRIFGKVIKAVVLTAFWSIPTFLFMYFVLHMWMLSH